MMTSTLTGTNIAQGHYFLPGSVGGGGYYGGQERQWGG